jgi:ferredoxin
LEGRECYTCAEHATTCVAAMSSIRFEPSGTILDDVPPGTRVVDLTDEHPESEVPFDCRAANCGTCRVEVREGAEALAEPLEEERDLLELLGNEPRVRLCCQLRLRDDASPDARITLRVVDPG